MQPAEPGRNSPESPERAAPAAAGLLPPQALVALYAAGRYAEVLVELATAAAPSPMTLNIGGASAWRLGRTDLAERYWRAALAVQPMSTEMHSNLGVLLHAGGRAVEAAMTYRRALTIRPDYAEGQFNLGNLLSDLNRAGEAELCFTRATRLHPVYVDAYFNLGNLLNGMSRFADAEAAYRNVLARQPVHAEACGNLGFTLQQLGRWEEAEAAYRKALCLRPNYPEAWNNFGVLSQERKRPDLAETQHRRALQGNSAYPDAYCNLAVLLYKAGRRGESDETIAACLRVAPAHAAARLHELFNCLPIVPADRAEAENCLEKFDNCLGHWGASVLPPEIAKAAAEVIGHRQPFYLAYRPVDHCQRLARLGRITAALMAKRYPRPWPLAAPGAIRRARLVVVSAHIRRHSVWDVLLHGLLSNLDRSRFEVILIHTSRREDAVTLDAKSLADGYYGGCNDASDCLRIIAELRPEILFYPEIGMNPTTNKLANLRLAPLQLASWGHPITTGLPGIDLFLSGQLLEPDHAQAHYTERLIRLPGTGACTLAPAFRPEPLSSELCDRIAAKAGPRFIVCQNPQKFDPADDVLFPVMAKRLGRCTFFLSVKNEAGDILVARLLGRLRAAFADQGLNPDEYLAQIPWLQAGQFLTLLDRMDVFLDCPAFSGYTTAWLAAHRGLPIVTLEGGFLRQRLAAGMLRQMAATDGIALSRDSYIDTAIRLARASRDAGPCGMNRQALMRAATALDRQVDVVRAFEQTLVEELARLGYSVE